MEISITQRWTITVLLTALLAFGSLVGCEDDSPTGSDTVSLPITATSIIVNPKSPAPGDTVQLTVVLESDTVNPGDFPKIAWTASAGDFLDNGEMSVRWRAPAASQLVDIGVTATNTVSTAARSTTIFVGSAERLIASQAGQIFLRPNGTDFVYLRSPLVTSGVEVYEYRAGAPVDLVPGSELGKGTQLSASLQTAVYQRDAQPAGNFIEPINVYYADLVAGTSKKLTSDLAESTSRRKQQYKAPSVSPNDVLVAYQGLRPSPLGIKIDTLDVYTYNRTTDATVNITATHGGRRVNAYPTFSTDGKWLVFVSDRNARESWELYGLPVTGNQVATDSSATVRLTTTNGQVTSGTILTLARPFHLWNPASPVMALVGTSGTLFQMTMKAQGADLLTVTGVGAERPMEMVWSGDGSALALTDGSSIFTVPVGLAAATRVHSAAAGDLVRDLAWSPSLDMMVYRVTRGQASWFELLNLTSGKAPVVLTQAIASGEAGAYRSVMSVSPAYTQANELIMLFFNAATPSVWLLDLSGAVQ